MELNPAHGSGSRHLDDLLAGIDSRVRALAIASVTADQTREALLDTVHATLRLDGSTVERDEVATLVDAGPDTDARPDTDDAPATDGHTQVSTEAGPGAHVASPPASWWTTLRAAAISDAVGDAGDEPAAGSHDDARLRDAEVRGALDALTATEVTRALHSDPLDVLRDLHVRLTRGLVAPERAGRPRELAQAVHDASVGRILYFTADPEQVDAGLAEVARLLREADGPAVVTAGLVHLQLLRVHPFDAANGRLARTVTRAVLRHAGLDPHGLVAFEPVLAADPLGYHERVAAALRARDPRPWLEYWAETVLQALRDAGRRVGATAADPDPQAVRALATLPRELTLVDLRDALGTDVDRARAHADRLADAGMLELVRGSSGLRFVRTGA